MSSGIYTTVKLHPFYQQFLRGQFQQTEQVFQFPKGHDLLMRLEFFLAKAPADFKPANYGKQTFRIEIPYMEHKDPFYYNYISENKSVLFARRIREYFRDVIHEEIGRARRKGFTRSEIIYGLMEELHISPTYFDLMEKEYKRYLQAERSRRFKKGKKTPQLRRKKINTANAR